MREVVVPWSTKANAALLPIGAAVVLATMVGCAEERPLSDEQVCDELHAALTSVGLSWPVASQPVNEVQLRELGERFEAIRDRTDGDMQTILAAWLQGFDQAVPYLVTGDQDGFLENTDMDLQDQLHLSSNLLATRCGWTA